MRVHLGTDFAGDTDDACALAYHLARDDVDLVAVTTVADADGRRAAYARYFLELAADGLDRGRRPTPAARRRTGRRAARRAARRPTLESQTGG
jgi:hypothetical protein